MSKSCGCWGHLENSFSSAAHALSRCDTAASPPRPASLRKLSARARTQDGCQPPMTQTGFEVTGLLIKMAAFYGLRSSPSTERRFLSRIASDGSEAGVPLVKMAAPCERRRAATRLARWGLRAAGSRLGPARGDSACREVWRRVDLLSPAAGGLRKCNMR